MKREAQLERERRLGPWVGLATIVGIVLIVTSFFIAPNASNAADLLREFTENETAALIAAVLGALGFVLLAPVIIYLFQAARFRNDAVRGQLIGLLIVAPIFIAITSILGALSNLDAAETFVERGLQGDSDKVVQIARDLRADASLRPLASGFGIAGALGFAFGVAYTCLQAMRVGLLSRFWGSLGMALGVTTFIIPDILPFLFLWFIYIALLVAVIARRNGPPAWAAGRAVPWPSPGERAAEQLAAREANADAAEESAIDETPANPQRQRGERRKRKRRT